MSTAATPVLVARALTRGFGGVRALDGVDLDLAAGEAVALLGPNGAGKTTLLTILAGVAARDGGDITWAEGARRRVGWVPQRPALYPRLSVRENLRLFAALERAGDPDALAGELIARADLEEYADRGAAQLSTGTLQRLNLAISLAGRPSVLLLDEPTATLSPDQRIRLWGWLDELRSGGMALMFSTQSVDEAVRHGDRLLVLGGGRLLFAGTAERMTAAHGGGGPGAEAAERAFMQLVSGRGEGDAR
ncbi:MAG TPA: ABC transporter ATP-binding protein [Miltoncostaeaceae bacterium]|nr:ABC transporter ATP-binding protein [Miltoncostaeaceae bacterium]